MLKRASHMAQSESHTAARRPPLDKHLFSGRAESLLERPAQPPGESSDHVHGVRSSWACPQKLASQFFVHSDAVLTARRSVFMQRQVTLELLQNEISFSRSHGVIRKRNHEVLGIRDRTSRCLANFGPSVLDANKVGSLSWYGLVTLLTTNETILILLVISAHRLDSMHILLAVAFKCPPFNASVPLVTIFIWTGVTGSRNEYTSFSGIGSWCRLGRRCWGKHPLRHGN
jgi:hypothetical protein